MSVPICHECWDAEPNHRRQVRTEPCEHVMAVVYAAIDALAVTIAGNDDCIDGLHREIDTAAADNAARLERIRNLSKRPGNASDLFYAIYKECCAGLNPPEAKP